MASITISITHEEVLEHLVGMISSNNSAYQDAALTIAYEILKGDKQVDQAYLVRFEF